MWWNGDPASCQVKLSGGRFGELLFGALLRAMPGVVVAIDEGQDVVVRGKEE